MSIVFFVEESRLKIKDKILDGKYFRFKKFVEFFLYNYENSNYRFFNLKFCLFSKNLMFLRAHAKLYQNYILLILFNT